LYDRPMSTRVGMIGLGNMGGRIARRIAAAGYEITGFDLDPSRAGVAGITAAATPDELVGAAEVLLLSLPDSTVVEPVVRDLAPSLGASHTVVDLSTSAPSSTTALHTLLAEREVELVDAGISGGAAAAETGTLTVMTGGDAATVDALRPLLGTFATRVVHMGASGAGHTAKLLNNFLNGIGLAATAEVMVAGRKAGLDLRLLLEVLNNSSGVNFATLNRFPHIVEGDYLEGGLTGNLMLKDLLLYRDLVDTLGVRTLNAAGCIATFELAAELGYGEQISNRVVDALGDVSGGIRVNESEGVR